MQTPGHTIPVKDVPHPQKTNGTWIADTANVLSADTEAMLNQKIDKFKARKSAEIILVIVDETKPSPSIEDFTRQLFDSWSRDFPQMNTTVLLVVSKYENRAVIEVGHRLEKGIHPVEIKKILINHIYLALDNGHLEEGIISGIEDLTTIIKPPSTVWSKVINLLLVLLLGGLLGALVIEILKQKITN
ncbi:MAG: TPM domain-containing protein [Cyanobacteria bacterium P01_D01_bin.56]